jgi:serine O-acetyltransferase
MKGRSVPSLQDAADSVPTPWTERIAETFESSGAKSDVSSSAFALCECSVEWRLSLFENIREDWRTHYRRLSCQGLWAMVVYRYGHWLYAIRRRWLRLPFTFLYIVLRPVCEVLTGIELPCRTTLGRRFRISHFGGIVIHPYAVFGDDCVIRQGVTVGEKGTADRGVPVFGNRVDIGAGAKVLGGILIGDDVQIGANAVVITDIPSNSLAVGVPAQVLRRKTPIAAASE